MLPVDCGGSDEREEEGSKATERATVMWLEGAAQDAVTHLMEPLQHLCVAL